MRSRTVVTIIVAAMSAIADSTTTWPQFRGPGGNGIAAGNPPIEFTHYGKNQLWKAAIQFGQSSPSVWGDRIFITSGERSGKALTISAHHRLTGKLLWQRSKTVDRIEQTHPTASPATATVLTDQDRAYAYFGSWGLLCYDHEGNELWSVRLPLPQKLNGSGTSPILAGDNVLLSRDDPTEAYLLALDRKTGKQMWKVNYGTPAPGPGVSNTSTPALLDHEVVVHRASEIVGLDAKSGSRRWFVKVSSTGVGTPVSADDAVYVSTWNNFGEPDLRKAPPSWDDLVKGDKDGDGLLTEAEMPATLALAERPGVNYEGAHLNLPPKVVLSFADSDKDGKLSKGEYLNVLKIVDKMAAGDHGLIAIKRGGTGDVTASHVLWKYSRNIAEVPTPLYANNRVYMVTNGGIVTCVQASTGKLIYRGRLGAAGAYFSSPIAANGYIYFSSGDGVVTVIKEGEDLKVVAHNDLQEPIHATPAVVGNTIYVRTATHLYAFAAPESK